jgi:hypothetical protein
MPKKNNDFLTNEIFGKIDPKEAYQKIRERMLELEIERDEL